MNDSDFLADAIHQSEFYLWEHDGQWNSGKPATGADIDEMLAWYKLARLSQCHRMKHMVNVEHVHVFARNHIDARVVIGVKRTQLCELYFLFLGEIGEVFKYDFWSYHVIFLVKNAFIPVITYQKDSKKLKTG